MESSLTNLREELDRSDQPASREPETLRKPNLGLKARAALEASRIAQQATDATPISHSSRGLASRAASTGKPKRPSSRRLRGRLPEALAFLQDVTLRHPSRSFSHPVRPASTRGNLPFSTSTAATQKKNANNTSDCQFRGKARVEQSAVP